MPSVNVEIYKSVANTRNLLRVVAHVPTVWYSFFMDCDPAGVGLLCYLLTGFPRPTL